MANTVINFSGQKFGKLTPIDYYKIPRVNYPGRHIVYWNCKCDCGNKCSVLAKSLKSGACQSCGCWKKERDKERGLALRFPASKATFNKVVRSYKRKGVSFSLTEEEFKFLILNNCYYCDKVPSNLMRNEHYDSGHLIYNGIDRIDSKLGYSIDNVVTCCKFCNISKNNRSLEEFELWILRVYTKMIKNKSVYDRNAVQKATTDYSHLGDQDV